MAQFHWADYLVFVVMLVVSIMTGIYFAYTDRKKRNVEEFLMAGRKMSVIPVAFSLFVSWMSGISFVGDPVECYKYGFIYILLVAGYAVGTALSAYFAPKFHELRILSAFEFLEMRYSRGLRLVCSAMLIFQLTIWQGIATYAPALALSQASGIPVWASNVLIGLVCTFYTAVGGMKAVIWTDTIQMSVMLAGQIAIVVQGSVRMGGITEVFRVAQEGGRLNFQESVGDFNPLSRAALWSFFIGGITRVFCVFISNQLMIQRYCTVSTARDARNAVLLVIPMFCVMSSLIALGGLIMYSLYSDCDPLLSGQIQRRDQMVAYLVIDLLGFMPGIPGLFLATVFSASLSSLSSGMNAIAAMLLADFIEPLYRHYTGSALAVAKAAIIAKWLAVLSGLTVVVSSFLPMVLGSTVFAMTSITEGAVVGPSSGVFFLAIVFPHIKTLFVHVAYGISLTLCLVVAVLGQIFPERGPWDELPLSTEGCPVVNTSIYSNGSWMGEMMLVNTRKPDAYFNTSAGTFAQEKPPFSFSDIHQMNPLLYLPLGFTTVLGIAGLLHSFTVCRDLVGGVNDARSDSKKDDDDNPPEKDPMLILTTSFNESPTIWSTSDQPDCHLKENNRGADFYWSTNSKAPG